VEPQALDSLDLKLLQALQLDGRAPFKRIAEVLGVSDQTVARRLRRLGTTAPSRPPRIGTTAPCLVGLARCIARGSGDPLSCPSESVLRRSLPGPGCPR
jgi:hypothetical protein